MYVNPEVGHDMVWGCMKMSSDEVKVTGPTDRSSTWLVYKYISSSDRFSAHEMQGPRFIHGLRMT